MPGEHQYREMFIDSYQPELFIDFDGSTVVTTYDMVLFWKPPSPFGQWTISPFHVDGIQYQCAEQFMMAEKARLFGDHDAAVKILESSDPRTQKKLGKSVKGFDETTWVEYRFGIVLKGNIAKFQQNHFLRDILMETGDRLLVEASPLDRIWGIGLAANHPDAYHREKWMGLNLLGKVLMETRASLQG